MSLKVSPRAGLCWRTLFILAPERQRQEDFCEFWTPDLHRDPTSKKKKLNKKNNNPVNKWAHKTNTQFSKDGIQIAIQI